MQLSLKKIKTAMTKRFVFCMIKRLKKTGEKNVA